MKAGKKLLASILALAFSLMLVSSWPGAAVAEENSSVANRFNVMLVMDKSGSLCDARGVGTDPEGLRFDAMKLFLGLLTETGNNVGVIAFDDTIRHDSGMRVINSMEDKRELVREVEGLGTSYDTDIGAAVLRAAEILRGVRAENDLPCAILLLTDGMTDFSPEDPVTILMEQSRAAAEKALEIAQDEGITIHGILLNVDGRARNGEEEIRFYTDGTKGQLETVSKPGDLAMTFGRFYSIINKTEYTGAHKIVFPDQGEVDTGFLVPGFGMEEVNIVIERDGSADGLEDICIRRPDGGEYDIDEHMIETSRFQLIKVPNPTAGKWDVTLKGEPGDSVDVCLIYNASMSVALSGEPAGGAYEVLRPVRFRAVVTAADADIQEDQLRSIKGELAVRSLADGEVTKYPMDISDGAYSAELTFEKGGDYEITALVGLTDFEVRSDTLELTIDVPLPAAKRGGVSDVFEIGSIADDVWELAVDGLFEDPKGTELRYALSDDCGGAVTLENGVLRAKLRELGGEAAFTVTATDAYDLSAQLPFRIEIAYPAAKLDGVTDLTDAGTVSGNVWELPLDELFDAADGLDYVLSDDCGGDARKRRPAGEARRARGEGGLHGDGDGRPGPERGAALCL